MSDQALRIIQLCDTAQALVELELAKGRAISTAVLELISGLREGSRDPRLKRLGVLVQDLLQHSADLGQLVRHQLGEQLRSEVDRLSAREAGSRLSAILDALLAVQPMTLSRCSESVLDALFEQLPAERGFILFWEPESTEADILAARNFKTRLLSTGEYHLSRTLLHKVLEGAPLSLEDAASHPVFGDAHSVREFRIRSVLAVPLLDGPRTVGAVYLENNSRPCAFGDEGSRLVQNASRLFMFCLKHARLLPALLPARTKVFLDATQASTELAGRDPAIQALLALVARIADAPASVLIEGESGTGKELVARALHTQSRRKAKPFVTINCAAIPEGLFESELFGHEKGAFTGATEQYLGQIQMADGGTAFFDEIGELPLQLQPKLLRLLQSGEYLRLGARQPRHSDLRIVAATSRDLKQMMLEGRFLEALYFRLMVIPIQVPRLADRRGDIPLLIEHFRARFARIYGRDVQLDPEVAEILAGYPFPGNVRELENLVHRLVAVSPDGHIGPADLPREIREAAFPRITLGSPPGLPHLQTPPRDLADLKARRGAMRNLMVDQERQLIHGAIQASGGNLSEAARRLGLHRVTLHKLLKRS